jgi:site-specific recombinase XerC
MFHDIFDQIASTEFFIWDAVVAWSNHIRESHLKQSTQSTYLTNMLKLIDEKIVNERLHLEKVDSSWLKNSMEKIDEIPTWSDKTKSIRRSCLNGFYNFIKKLFDYKTDPYRRPPKPNEIKYVLSNVLDQNLTATISPESLCSALSKINERDAYIVWIMMLTGQPLEAVLDRRKKHLRGFYYLDFENEGEPLPKHLCDVLREYCQNSNTYIFETSKGKRIRRTQVMRTLKQAGYNIGLKFDLTPKALHRYVNAYMSSDKRYELEKALFP